MQHNHPLTIANTLCHQSSADQCSRPATHAQLSSVLLLRANTASFLSLQCARAVYVCVCCWEHTGAATRRHTCTRKCVCCLRQSNNSAHTDTWGWVGSTPAQMPLPPPAVMQASSQLHSTDCMLLALAVGNRPQEQHTLLSRMLLLQPHSSMRVTQPGRRHNTLPNRRR